MRSKIIQGDFEDPVWLSLGKAFFLQRHIESISFLVSPRISRPYKKYIAKGCDEAPNDSSDTSPPLVHFQDTYL